MPTNLSNNVTSAPRTSHEVFVYTERKDYCSTFAGNVYTVGSIESVCEVNVVTIKSSQKLFTADEVSRLTGICLEHLQSLARSKHLGFLARAAEAAGAQAEEWLFTNSDLMILTVLYPRCQHKSA